MDGRRRGQVREVPSISQQTDQPTHLFSSSLRVPSCALCIALASLLVIMHTLFLFDDDNDAACIRIISSHYDCIRPPTAPLFDENITDILHSSFHALFMHCSCMHTDGSCCKSISLFTARMYTCPASYLDQVISNLLTKSLLNVVNWDLTPEDGTEGRCLPDTLSDRLHEREWTADYECDVGQ